MDDIPVHKSSHTLRQKLAHPKDKTPKHQLNAEVYAVQCSETCSNIYIGETKQALHERVAQHRRATRTRLSCTSASKGQRSLFRGCQCHILDREDSLKEE